MFRSLWAALRARAARRPPRPAAPARPLVVVEGKHDIEFLRRGSRTLHDDNPRLPELGEFANGAAGSC